MSLYELNTQRQMVRSLIIQQALVALPKAYPGCSTILAKTLPGELFRFEHDFTQAFKLIPTAVNFICAERDESIYNRARKNKPDNCVLVNADIVDLKNIGHEGFVFMWYDVCGAVTRAQIKSAISTGCKDMSLVNFTTARNRRCANLEYVTQQLGVQASCIDDALTMALQQEAVAYNDKVIALGTIDFLSGTLNGEPDGRTPFRVHTYQIGQRVEPIIQPFGAIKLCKDEPSSDV